MSEIRRTTALEKILRLRRRIRVIQGGTSASKTFSILMYLIDKAQSRSHTSISVVSASLPHLKRGAIRDFLFIMKTTNHYSDASWNRSDFIYTFANGSFIEFFSVDTPDKARGPRRKILFINECDALAYETFSNLEVRTSDEVILDFNPVVEFWVHKIVMQEMEHEFLKLTYKDNETLDPKIVASIESRKKNKNWWRVYGLGEIGVLEGSIYEDWKIIPSVPDEARLVRYGLDFGYSIDPAACVAVYEHDGGFVLDEVIYETKLKNPAIASRILEQPEQALVIGDSAEPKSIDEIEDEGVDIVGSMKGADSIRFGINTVQDQKISVTQGSVNVIREYRGYKWRTNKDGEPMNKPEEGFDHAMDAIRYAITDIKKPEAIYEGASADDYK